MVRINTLLVLLVVLVMLALNALYVAAEFAMVSSRRSRLVELVNQGNRKAAALLQVVSDPRQLDHYVAASQVGITLSSLVLGAYGQAQLTPIVAPLFEGLGGLQQAAAVTVATLLVLVVLTLLQVVLAELLPKTIAVRYPEQLGLLTLAPMQVSLWVFRPLIRVLNGTALSVLRRLGVQATLAHAHVHTPDELEILFLESARGGMIDLEERDLLRGMFSLEDKNVREVMVPRVRMNAIEVGRSALEVLDEAVKCPYTRLPVFEGHIDRVIGVVHVRDVFMDTRQQQSPDVRHLVRPVLILPDVLSVRAAWEEMKLQRADFAILTDEFGGTSGLLTLEDIMEEVFGELQDEFDTEEATIRPDGEDFLIRGDVSIQTVNSQLEVDLPDEDAYTMSGLVWSELEQVPEPGATIELEQVHLKVETMQGKQVTLVRLIKATHPPAEDQA